MFSTSRNIPESPGPGLQPPSNEIGHVTLSAFLLQIRSRVAENPQVWITGEITGTSDKGGHLWLNLAETDKHGKISAKAEAVIWSSNRHQVLAEFRNTTNGDPEKGMRILALVKANVHVANGQLKLEILDLDPNYTLGEIERHLNKMRRALQEKGLYDINRTHYPCPSDFFRVAVISPGQAASLKDFRQVADRLESAGLCAFSYHNAQFQGANCCESIFGAIRTLVLEHRNGSHFCAVCVIRGGGSATDLADLNQYRLAHAICHSPFPVMTGIGHEPDNCLLDEVASRKFDTPSKLALHIRQSIITAAQAAESDWQEARNGGLHRVARDRTRCERLREIVASAARSSVALSEKKIEEENQSLRNASAIMSARSRDIERLREFVAVRTRQIVEAASRGLEANSQRLSESGLILLNATLETERLRAIVATSSAAHLALLARSVEEDRRQFSLSRTRVSEMMAEADRCRKQIAADVAARCQQELPKVATDALRVSMSAANISSRARGTLDATLQGVLHGARDTFLKSQTAIKTDMQTVAGLGPGRTISRGFAIVRDRDYGRVITRRPAAIDAESMTIEFSDGKISVRRTDDDI